MDTKALRQKILDLAIRGKLVPQDPNDEPAEVLLKRIREQKQQMLKEGKLKKKDIKNDTIIFKGEDNLHYEKFQDGTVKCIEDEIPFEVPEGWCWCRLRDICMMLAGKSKPADQIKSEYFEGSYPCFGGNGIRGYVDEYNQDGTFSIVGRQGALCGNINVATGKFYATEHAVVTTLFVGIDFKWSNYILEALRLNKYATGAAQPGLSVANILNVFVPIPPTQEQDRIGNNIDKSLKIIEVIEQEKTDLQKNIITAKSKILDLAIRGKLVPQAPNGEPASVLLERIRAEKEKLILQGKIKRDKKESVIFKGDDNSYYGISLPTGWSWTILKDISFSISDGSHNPPSNKEFGVPLLSAANVNNNSILINNASRWITNEEWEIENQRTDIEIGDVLLTIVGSIGRSAVVETNEHFALQRSVAVIKPCLISPFYLMRIFQAPQIQKWINDNSKGTAQKGIYLNALSIMTVPIPPLDEQLRIVKQISIFFEQLDLISSSLLC
ncbi:restriction endonuclease subunit S [Roseburia intestinalis]|uniref:restriction endonuclease subunit S n=1 Tax=Roseburia intestinalis TaxID=166486 RepID=UPI0021A3DC28|nr:restriction endonuclease subunit S [Roseburia intestinalis]UWP56836.1 restriction endonuclease subunit S [Roseburia intestinalis]